MVVSGMMLLPSLWWGGQCLQLCLQYRIKALAQKHKSHDQVKEPEPKLVAPTDEIDAPVKVLPPIVETPHETTPPMSTPRATTPLERTLLELLSDADLGATGFLKANELKAVLLKLGKVRD